MIRPDIFLTIQKTEECVCCRLYKTSVKRLGEISQIHDKHSKSKILIVQLFNTNFNYYFYICIHFRQYNFCRLLVIDLSQDLS